MDRISRLFPFTLNAAAIDTAHFLTLKSRITSCVPNSDGRHKLTHTFGRSDINIMRPTYFHLSSQRYWLISFNKHMSKLYSFLKDIEPCRTWGLYIGGSNVARVRNSQRHHVGTFQKRLNAPTSRILWRRDGVMFVRSFRETCRSVPYNIDVCVWIKGLTCSLMTWSLRCSSTNIRTRVLTKPNFA